MKKLAVALMVAGLLTACGHSDQQQAAQAQQYAPQPQQYAQQQPPQVVQTAPAPVIVQAAPQQNNAMQDMLLGGVIGHMIGSSGSRGVGGSAPSAGATTVVNKTVINKTYVQAAPTQIAAPKRVQSYAYRPPATSSRSFRR